ncbi:MAG TPA: xanthine dehydrogenase family protein molybdopterin-binding subunit [Chloroflexota bacterium]
MESYGKAQGWIGASIRRKEDGRLLTGTGRYVDDVQLPDMLHLAVLRSPHAHARISGIDVAPARARHGVVAAADGATMRDRLGPLPTGQRKQAEHARVAVLDPELAPVMRMEVQPLLAVEKARYVGEGVALVLAESRYAAEDAAEQIVVEYEPLPPVADAQAASAPDAPRVHDEFEDNVSLRLHVRAGDAAAAFARADRVVRRRFRMQRITGIPIETRGVVARPEPDGGLTVWAASQSVHASRDAIAQGLGMDPARIRVIAQDVGGGFGIKSGVYPEVVLVAWLAREYGRPVKWIEDRTEHLRTATQTRDQAHDIELALAADGTILGLRDHFMVDGGAYNPLGLGQPHNSASHLVGAYRVPAVDVEGTVYYSNKAHFAPYRGAGRPEAVFAMERLLDSAARELGQDPAEFRRRNLVTAAEMPYDTGIMGRDGQNMIYDSGDYPACFEKALELVGYDALRREQPALRARGVYRGVGLTAYVESTGSGPFEGAVVGLDADGHVWVYTGACSQGQGMETAFAQVAAEQLGVSVDQVTVVPGDTAGIARGQGTRASRSTVTAGAAIGHAARTVGERVRAVAAALLEASPADVEMRGDAVCVRGVPDRAVTLKAIAAAAGEPNLPSPPSLRGKGGAGVADAAAAESLRVRGAAGTEGSVGSAQAGAPPALRGKGVGGLGLPLLALREEYYYEPPTFTYANAVQAAVVEVDVETGHVQLLKHAVVHDSGRVINPVLADGQVCGGVAQGIGNALMEEVVYDENGQLLSGSLMDYLVPTACDVPPIALGHFESPSPRNPLGFKGMGEGGAIAPPAAIANAVEDALRPFGVEVPETPLSPERVLGLIEAARGAADALTPTLSQGERE